MLGARPARPARVLAMCPPTMTAARSFTLLLSLPLAIVIGAFFLMPMGELFLRSKTHLFCVSDGKTK